MTPTNAAWLLMLVFPGQAEAAPEPAAGQPDAKESARWTELYRREAKQYEIFGDEDRRVALHLQKNPVFRFADPISANKFNGDFFVWTRHGRPEVVGSIWSSGRKARPGKRTICHSFHSLALGPLHAKRNGGFWWSPTTPGIDPKPVPGAPPPAENPRLRLVQMRSLAREFTVTQLVDEVESVERELRLLPQPIYRFEANPKGVQDGALFLFLNDWDPEVLLVLEVRDTPNGPHWHFAPVRFCYLSARVKHNGREVWSYQRGGPMTDRSHYYLSIHGASYVDRDLTE
ncbi:MAG: hypothetical protein KY475_24795 [Planctomycetes bacterium]|nr:hypothetical protein [Planctomycetota bacterium]